MAGPAKPDGEPRQAEGWGVRDYRFETERRGGFLGRTRPSSLRDGAQREIEEGLNLVEARNRDNGVIFDG